MLVFGLLHAYLIWYGDILVLYAVCGFVVLFDAPAAASARLLMIGILMIAIGSGISLLFGWSVRFWPPEEIEKFTDDLWLPPQEELAAEVAAYRGGWLDQMPKRVKVALEFHVFVMWIWGIWRAGGLMLVGMALYKWGVFDARRSSAFYGSSQSWGWERESRRFFMGFIATRPRTGTCGIRSSSAGSTITGAACW